MENRTDFESLDSKEQIVILKLALENSVRKHFGWMGWSTANKEVETEVEYLIFQARKDLEKGKWI